MGGDDDVNAALQNLYASEPVAKTIGTQAKAVLVFPNIVKAGFIIGACPSIVIVNKSKAKSLTTTTLKDDIYAFIFSQKGLMAGLGLQGSKITKISK